MFLLLETLENILLWKRHDFSLGGVLEFKLKPGLDNFFAKSVLRIYNAVVHD